MWHKHTNYKIYKNIKERISSKEDCSVKNICSFKIIKIFINFEKTKKKSTSTRFNE